MTKLDCSNSSARLLGCLGSVSFGHLVSALDNERSILMYKIRLLIISFRREALSVGREENYFLDVNLS